MNLTGRPRWQQFTALVSLSTGGAITGFSFAPGAVADITTPTSMPIRLMALAKSAQPAASDDTMLRSAIVNVASYYLRMAESKTPAEMEQIIWQHDSLDGVDHGPSCAAFASLTLELGAQVVGQQSWVTGGTSYPWPLHAWADVRVDPNPDSMGITSVLQDAEANGRWHAQGDGYDPQPGDWVLFDGHVEVVTKYVGGILYTIGGDSLPNFSVNAHEYPGPLGAQGVVGFVNNGELTGASQSSTGSGAASPGSPAAVPGSGAGSPAPRRRSPLRIRARLAPRPRFMRRRAWPPSRAYPPPGPLSLRPRRQHRRLLRLPRSRRAPPVDRTSPAFPPAPPLPARPPRTGRRSPVYPSSRVDRLSPSARPVRPVRVLITTGARPREGCG